MHGLCMCSVTSLSFSWGSWLPRVLTSLSPLSSPISRVCLRLSTDPVVVEVASILWVSKSHGDLWASTLFQLCTFRHGELVLAVFLLASEWSRSPGFLLPPACLWCAAGHRALSPAPFFSPPPFLLFSWVISSTYIALTSICIPMHRQYVCPATALTLISRWPHGRLHLHVSRFCLSLTELNICTSPSRSSPHNMTFPSLMKPYSWKFC